jgi:hypothetical protein
MYAAVFLLAREFFRAGFSSSKAPVKALKRQHSVKKL